MSACSPLMMLCACVVLPPNDVRNCTSWPSWASFHSDCHVEINLPYAVCGLLYAARVTTGEAAGEDELHPAAPALELEHAASPKSERTSGAAWMRRVDHRGMSTPSGWAGVEGPTRYWASASGGPVAHRRPRKDAAWREVVSTERRHRVVASWPQLTRELEAAGALRAPAASSVDRRIHRGGS